MAGADLDDPARPVLAHQHVGGGGVEAREPVLIPARLRRRVGTDRGKRLGIDAHAPQQRGKIRLGCRKNPFQRLVASRLSREAIPSA
jgi:hypothetical protein